MKQQPFNHILNYSVYMSSEPLFYTLISRFQRLYTKSLTMRLLPYGVQPGYLAILQALWQKDNVTQKELVRRLDIEQATLSNTLKRMQRDGLLQCTPNKNDRRRQVICLTAKGGSLQQIIDDAINDLRKVVYEGLTVNDRRYFKRILRQMTEKLEEDQAEPLFVLLDEVAEDA